MLVIAIAKHRRQRRIILLDEFNRTREPGVRQPFHMIENYVLSPWAYGDRLKLSNVAVILAFAIGGELAR